MIESARIQAVQSPIIPVVGELIRQHPGTISLGQGVVYYPPPPQAMEQVTQFFAEPEYNKYQSVQGIAPLQAAIATKLQTENGIALSERNCIVVTGGSNLGFVNALMAIADMGDEIILQTPYYFNHEMAIAMAGCRAVLVPTDEHYQLQLDAIAQAMTPRTKAIVTISPNNPTGAVYSAESLKAVNQLCQSHGIYHISDEAYEYFVYDDAQHVSPASIPQSEDYTISLFSLSKAYGFASWRIGYMVLPTHLLTAVKKIQDTILICPPVVSQWAAVGALQAGRHYCLEKRGAIAHMRESVLQELSKISEICTVPPALGAFYVLLKVNTAMNANEMMERLIREYGVAVIPGTTFGLETGCYLRVAYGALQLNTVQEGMNRLLNGLKNLA
ncbi:pyridoxal phosphate-dependent aminotransferase [Leptolyngbya sp. AN02str]